MWKGRREAYRKLPDRPEHKWVWSPQGVIDMHRPEKVGLWCNFLPLHQEKSPFIPIRVPVRDLLMQVYYAQRAFHQNTGAMGRNVEELQFPFCAHAHIPNRLSSSRPRRVI